jgi:hypothetical protein
MESSFKIDLKDMSWWMSIKESHKFRAPITTKISKERYISLIARGRPFHATCKHD